MTLENSSDAARALVSAGFAQLPAFKKSHMFPFAIEEFTLCGRNCLVTTDPVNEIMAVLYDIQRGFYRLSAEIGTDHASHVVRDVAPPVNIALYCRAYAKAFFAPRMEDSLPTLSIADTFGSQRAALELVKKGAVSPLIGVAISTSKHPYILRNMDGTYVRGDNYFAKETLQ